MTQTGKDKPTDTYESLKPLSLPLLEAYHDDLQKHDRRWLAENPGVPFLHFTRDWGTHIIPLFPANHPSWPARGKRVPYLFGHADREHILDQAAAVLGGIQDSYSADIRLTLYFDGKALRTITPDRADRIVRDYTNRVRHAWRHLAEEVPV